MKYFLKYRWGFMICVMALLIGGTMDQANAHNVTLSLYNQGFNANEFYDNGDFSVDDGIMNSDPKWLLVVIGDPANVEDIFETTGESNPFELELAGADFHFEVFQPFRFPDRFDGLFSTTVDDPVLLVLDNLAIADVRFYDDGVLADDRIDLSAHSAELPEFYFEVDSRDKLYLTMLDGTVLQFSNFTRLDDFTVSFDAAPVPEPGTIVLLGFGLAGLLGVLRKRGMKNILFSSLLTCMLSFTIFMIFFSSSVLAYEIGPEFCSSMSVAICGLFQNEYDSALGEPITTAVLTCYLPNGDTYPYPVVDSCPAYYKESWTQYYQNGYITCNDGTCLGYSTGFDPDNPDEPLTHPKLTDVESRSSCIELNNGSYQLSKNDFSYTFDPANPNFTMFPFYPTFSPSTVSFPLSDRTMVRDVTVSIDAGEYNPDSGPLKTDVTIVNPDIKFELNPMGIQLDFLNKVKAIQKYFDTFNKKIEKYVNFGGFCKPDFKFSPAIEVGAETFKICCPEPTCVKPALKLYLDFSCDFGGISCTVASVPVFYVFLANVALESGLSASFNLSRETSCEPRSDICGELGIELPGAGIKGSVKDISGKAFEASLTGSLNPSVSGEGCYNLSTKDWDFDGEGCIKPKIKVEAKLGPFIKKSATINLGGKKCTGLF